MTHSNDTLTENRAELAGVLNFGGTIARNVFTLPERIIETLAIWQTRWISRQNLRDIEYRQLEDVGLNREKIDAEAAKPFWKA